MLILPDYNKAYIVDSLTAPIVVKHHWIFHAPTVDFKLAPITYLEETSGPAAKVRINNFDFWVPTSWNILVTDRETFSLDTVSIQSCASAKHIAFSFSPDEMNLRTLDISVVDFCDNKKVVYPMINKGTGLVHPVGQPPAVYSGLPADSTAARAPLSVVIGPHDLYKHLNNKVVGDVFSW